MGTSTNAILFYGFTDDSEGENGWSEAYDNSQEDNVTYPGTSLDYHCSSDEPIYYLAIDVSETTAYRGHPKQLDRLTLAYSPLEEWEGTLREAATYFGIDLLDQKPAWYLVSYYSC